MSGLYSSHKYPQLNNGYGRFFPTYNMVACSLCTILYLSNNLLSQIFFCHTRLHLEFSAKLRIWQVPTCKMEPQSGIIALINHPPGHPPTRPPTRSTCAVSPPVFYICSILLCGVPPSVFEFCAVSPPKFEHLTTISCAVSPQF